MASNIGTWMQNVGASWLMTLLTPSPVLVALMQTATSLPIFLVGLPAGAIADLADRRKLLLITQAWMLAVATVLGMLALADLISTWALLALTFLLGLGAALNAPAWQAIVPELVGRRLIAPAIALNSAGYNLARAVGPALGGLVVAAAGPGAVFLLNAASFLGVLIVIYLWRRQPVENLAPPERVLGAIAAGARYARHSFSLQAVLVRSGAFVLAASALWALLPLVANRDLKLDASGYGILLGSLGLGAVVGAILYARLSQILTTDQLTMLATVAFTVATLGLAYVHNLLLLIPMLLVGGLGWMAAMSSFNISAQNAAPAWVRARVLGIYLLVFQGMLALGSFGWGALADRLGNSAALGVAALALFIGVATMLRWPLNVVEKLDLTPALGWPEPKLVVTPRPEDGPVLVTVEYQVAPENAAAFVRAMQRVGRMRRRTGAYSWGLYNDPSNPDRYMETFLTRTWAEHVRQHTRPTMTDQRIQDEAYAFQKPSTTPLISHFVATQPPGRYARR